MKKLKLLSMLLSALCFACRDPVRTDATQTRASTETRSLRPYNGEQEDDRSSPLDINGIIYHGGPLMSLVAGQPPNVYYIWYGGWSGSTARAILTDFAQNIGGSDYFKINTTYCNASDCSVGGTRVINAVAYGGSTDDNYSFGSSISQSTTQSIVRNAINSAALPSDPNGVYFVLTSPDVSETSGFCSQYCGYHTHTNVSGTDIKYSFIGSPAHCGGMGCYRQTTRSPNDNPNADGMANIIGHELEETVTDPDLNAWFDGSGNENADKCAWTFGSTYLTPNGSSANMRLGSRDFYIQRNWVNDNGGFCAKNLAPLITGFTPTSGSPGAPVTIHGVRFVNIVSVQFNGNEAAFNLISETQINGTVPDATPGIGPITVTSSVDGTGTSTTVFTIHGPGPMVSSFDPTSGHPGDTVNIHGSNFSGLVGPAAVRFNGANAAGYTVVDSTLIRAQVASGGGSTGPIMVTTQTGGSGSSTDSFSILGRFSATASLGSGRGNHTATLLVTDPVGGQVLLVGGNSGGIPNGTAELYDPVGAAFAFTGGLNQARAYHTATLLQDGRVLVVGGGDDTTSLASAEIYDPSTGQFSFNAGTLNTARRGHTATLLNDGTVLITGGLDGTGASLSSAEIYDPMQDQFTGTGDMNFARNSHTATLLNNGNVLVAGGPGTAAGTAGTTGELYSSGAFTVAGGFTNGRINHSAVLLNNGQVLISCGTNNASGVLYNPDTGVFTTFATPQNFGMRQAVSLLAGGQVVFTGGVPNASNARLYYPDSGTTFLTGSLTVGRSGHTSTLLNDGRLLLAGGDSSAGSSALLYDYNSP